MTDQPTRAPNGTFTTGNPGRPKGTRNRLGEAFVSALMDSFEKNGADAIRRVLEDKPADYLKVIGNLVPKEMTGADGAPLFEGITVQFVKSSKK